MASYLHAAAEESPRYENAPIVTPYRVSTVDFFIPIISGSRTGWSHGACDRRDGARC